ncbi:MAG: PIG-L family deacetylase [Candidatus Doudnabacteria bacterium]|nr:PIG-L family deacetylase [Candidatus Doudnabacteria bacterium]
MNFSTYLEVLLSAKEAAAKIPLGVYDPIVWPELRPDAPTAMLLSAHPDDEWLSFMPLGLRLRREGYNVVVVAVTLGRPEQHARRLSELTAACRYGGMELCVPGPEGKGLRDQIRNENGETFSGAVEEVLKLTNRYMPKVFITHHAEDGHRDHKSCNRLAKIATACSKQHTFLVETEYWQDIGEPNCQLEVAYLDVVRVMEGVSFHKGELERNPYHLTYPLLGMLNAQYVERVVGFGNPAAKFQFSVILKLTVFKMGRQYDYKHPSQLSTDQSVSMLFPEKPTTTSV